MTLSDFKVSPASGTGSPFATDGLLVL